MKLEEAKKRGVVKLNLGCGFEHDADDCKEEFVNVDIRESSVVDLKADIRDLHMIEDNSVDYVRAQYVLEHIPEKDVSKTLREWYRILKKGGKIEIAVPDLVRLAALFLADIDGRRWGKWYEGFYGAQEYPTDFHCSGFDKTRLENLLILAGFTEVKTSYFTYWKSRVRAVATK